jgi:hypothetical protein
MALAIRWLHEAGDPPHPTLRGGSMTLAIRWLHEGGETLGTWLHEAGDWQICVNIPREHHRNSAASMGQRTYAIMPGSLQDPATPLPTKSGNL